MRPIPGMHPFAVLYSCMGFFQGAPMEYEIGGDASPVLFSSPRGMVTRPA